MKKYLIILLLLFTNSISFAQIGGIAGKVDSSGTETLGLAYFSYETEKNIDAGADDGTTYDETTSNIGGSYLMMLENIGRLELGISSFNAEVTYNVSTTDADFNFDGLSYSGVLFPTISNLPIDVYVGYSFGDGKIKGNLIDNTGLDMTMTASGFDVGLFKSVYEQDNTEAKFYVNFNSYESETTMSYQGQTETTKDDGNSSSFGLVVRIDDWILNPAISRSDGESEFGITFGRVFPIK